MHASDRAASARHSAHYFWRRTFAFIVDCVIVSIVTLLLVWPLMASVGTDHIRLGIPAPEWTQCTKGTAISHEMAGALGQNRVAEVWYCRTYKFFLIDNGLRATITLGANADRQIVQAVLPVDDQGRPVTSSTPDVLVMFLLYILGLPFIAARRNGATYGKSIMKLHVAPNTFKRLTKRETLKWAPVISLTLGSLALAFVGQYTDLIDLHDLLTGLSLKVILILLAAFFIWYYVLPFFTGDRRQRYDRWGRCAVERL